MVIKAVIPDYEPSPDCLPQPFTTPETPLLGMVAKNSWCSYQTSSSDDASAVAEKIRHSTEVAALPHAKSPLEIVSVNIGVMSIAPKETTTPKDLIELADKALYESKQQGRNRVSVAA